MWVFDDNYSIVLSVFHKNTCCGRSLELPHRGDSNEYPHDHFYEEIRKSPDTNLIYSILLLGADPGSLNWVFHFSNSV